MSRGASGGSPPISPRCRALLVAFPSWVGDAVMATAVLRLLRHSRPHTRLVALVRPPLGELLAGAPALGDLIEADDRGLLGPWRAATALRRRSLDAALLLPNSFRRALAVALACIPVRVGYQRGGRRLLLTHPVPVPVPVPHPVPVPRTRRPIPLLEYYAHLCGSALAEPVEMPAPELGVTPADEAAADALLRGAGPRLAVLNPGANRPDKRWPAERFARVAEALAARGLSVAVTGSPQERDGVRAVVAGAPRAAPIDLIERGVRLGSLKAVLRRANVLVTGDTGPRHIAAALGTPAVCLFGPTDHRWTSLPAAREHLLLAEPFLPEELAADDHPRACAIERIAVGDVLAAVERLLVGRGAA